MSQSKLSLLITQMLSSDRWKIVWYIMTKSDAEKLVEKHSSLTHSQMQKVVSHVQREEGDWYLNTIMIEGVDVPFKYRRKQPYKSLKGARVNLTYYPQSEQIAGIDFEFMKVVRLKLA